MRSKGMTTSITIHEFSTGITPVKSADGGWVSKGFTGRYMNSTLKEIPHAVERSIANKEFAVAEGAVSDRPTAIGRVVGEWSVVALVTKGRDEKGRSASFYRYFLTNDTDGLSEIVSWIEDEQSRGRKLTFNPYDNLEQPHQVNQPTQNSRSKSSSDVLSETPAILDFGTKYSIQEINTIAAIKSKETGQPISWAFNVEALEKANRFQVIHPANDSAARRIRQSLSSATGKASTTEIDEQGIKVAIKNLVNASQIKPDSLQTLGESINSVETALGKEQAQSFWNEIFEGQGAGNALRQKIVSPQTSKLITIRAMILPGTVLEFLNWLQVDDSKKMSEQSKTSLALQSQMSSSKKSAFEPSLIIGIENVLEALFYEKLSYDAACWLLNSPESVWHEPTRQVIENIHYDFSTIGDRSSKSNEYKLNSRAWEEIRSKIKQRIHPTSKKPDNKYTMLANLFCDLNDNMLAACFYQLGIGEVPDNIYKSVKNDGNVQRSRDSKYEEIFSIQIKKETTIRDAFRVVISSIYTKYILIIASGILLVGGAVFTGWKLMNSDEQGRATKSPPSIAGEISIEKQSSRISDLDIIDKSIIAIIMPKGKVEGFELTKAEINRIIYDSIRMSSGSGQKTREEILNVIREEILAILKKKSNGPAHNTTNDILQKDVFSLTSTPAENNISLEEKIQQENWTIAIYLYQENNKLSPTGHISRDDKTSKKLQKVITEHFSSSTHSPSKTSSIESTTPLPKMPDHH
jgi:hypothetical protein